MSADLAPIDALLAGLTREELEARIAEASVVELAALWYDWRAWARPKQLPPAGEWRWWGFLGARGMGKTWSVSRYVNEEVNAGRVRSIGLAAQDEANCELLLVNGADGLIATAHPQNRPEYHPSTFQLVWPNGAKADVRTPERPGKIRGSNYDLFWATEIQSWGSATRMEAWSNIELSTRVGLARIVWDCTQQRGNPLLRQLRREAAENPELHRLVGGTMAENAANLRAGYVADMLRRYEGTRKGREELEGIDTDAEEGGATVARGVIHTRPLPSRLRRRLLAVDNATTARRRSDTTGIVEAGLGLDGQAYVIADLTGRYPPGVWAALVVDRYLAGGCDCIVVETNAGGDLVAQNIRSDATPRGIAVVVLDRGQAPPPHNPRVIYVREVRAKGEKSRRAEPVGTAYERGRVSHVEGAELDSLTDTLTTWEPGPHATSPGDLDALVHAIVELLALGASGAPRETVAENLTDEVTPWAL